MRTADDIRQIQREAEITNTLEGFLDRVTEYAKSHTRECSYEEYIYDEDKYLNYACLGILEDLGFDVTHREVEEEGDICKHQFIRIFW